MADKNVPLLDWAEYPVLVDMNFGDMITEREEIKSMIDDLTTKLSGPEVSGKRTAGINADIHAALIVAGVDNVLWNGIPVAIQNGCSPSKIDAKLLASLGVSPDIIRQATKPGTPYQYTIVRYPKQSKGESGSGGGAVNESAE